VGAPVAAILIPGALFFSVASPSAKEPNGLLSLAYVGAAFLAAAVLTVGVGLNHFPRPPQTQTRPPMIASANAKKSAPFIRRCLVISSLLPSSHSPSRNSQAFN
jgi:hypothetical protein